MSREKQQPENSATQTDNADTLKEYFTSKFREMGVTPRPVKPRNITKSIQKAGDFDAVAHVREAVEALSG